MGLDMYAYTINKDLVEGKGNTDVPVHQLAREATGFQHKSDAEYDLLSEDAKKDYWQQKDAADKKAKDSGIFDSEFAYWRKFNSLHGWMEDLYERKGGTDKSFNCNTVRLEPEDIEELAQAATDKKLAPVTGFFFGSQEEFNDEDRDEVLEFCTKSREAFEQGKAVFYDSWW